MAVVMVDVGVVDVGVLVPQADNKIVTKRREATNIFLIRIFLFLMKSGLFPGPG
jgi:sensor histidine kinase regulating citrate/malate metabolism